MACGPDIAMDVLEGLFERHELQKPDADLAIGGYWGWKWGTSVIIIFWYFNIAIEHGQLIQLIFNSYVSLP